MSWMNVRRNHPAQSALMGRYFLGRGMLRQAWRIKAGQRVLVIANGDGFRVNAEGKALNNAAVAQNARVRMISGQVVSGIVDSDGNILINL